FCETWRSIIGARDFESSEGRIFFSTLRQEKAPLKKCQVLTATGWVQWLSNMSKSDMTHPTMLGSLLTVWVLVGLFFYLNHYTRRRYFTIWAVAWLFY